MDLNTEEELTKLEKEFDNKGESDYLRELQHASFEQLESKMSELAKHGQTIAETQKNDPELIKVSKEKSSLEAPYREQKKWNGKRSKLVYLYMMENYPERMEAFGSSND